MMERNIENMDKSGTLSIEAAEQPLHETSAVGVEPAHLHSEMPIQTSRDEKKPVTLPHGKKHISRQKPVSRKGSLSISIALIIAVGMLISWHVLNYFIGTGIFATENIPYIKIFNQEFYLMMLAGFIAQMVDGIIGMGYGVTCTSILLSMGTNLSAISMSVNTAKIFSIGASGYNHFKLGNVNKKLFRVMVVPGVVGAIAGAILLVKVGEAYAGYIRPLLAAYTIFLGARIIVIAYRKNKKIRKVKNAGWLAAAGGFLDSFGGGGWGPLVTSTLISKGRTPRMVIGSVNITEAFVAFATIFTFFVMIGLSHWRVTIGLIIGGMIAAPFGARISGKLPVKTMLFVVGIFVVFWSLTVLVRTGLQLFH